MDWTRFAILYVHAPGRAVAFRQAQLIQLIPSERGILIFHDHPGFVNLTAGRKQNIGVVRNQIWTANIIEQCKTF